MVNNVEKRFHTSDCEIETISPLDENKKHDWINERWVKWKDHDRVFRAWSKFVNGEGKKLRKKEVNNKTKT